jgi:hypothetical protein
MIDLNWPLDVDSEDFDDVFRSRTLEQGVFYGWLSGFAVSSPATITLSISNA